MLCLSSLLFPLFSHIMWPLDAPASAGSRRTGKEQSTDLADGVGHSLLPPCMALWPSARQPPALVCCNLSPRMGSFSLVV